MFQNSGEKLRVFATIQFVLCIICAAVILFAGLVAVGFLAVIYAAVIVLSGFVSWLTLNTLADAAEQAKNAAYYAEQIALYINRQEQGEKEPEKKEQTQTAWNPNGKMPAWQRVELEKAEQARKASCEEQP